MKIIWLLCAFIATAGPFLLGLAPLFYARTPHSRKTARCFGAISGVIGVLFSIVIAVQFAFVTSDSEGKIVYAVALALYCIGFGISILSIAVTFALNRKRESNISEEIQHLSRLKDSRLITEEEFSQKKKKLLGI